jgi:hypothetical protein
MPDKSRENIMHAYINSLAQNLNLSAYQTNKIKADYDKYNVSRLQKRGGVLYAPYVVHGFWGQVSRILFGRQADLIGPNKTLLRAQRNIKFFANGLHCVKIGRYTYYADANGNNISFNEFKHRLKS